MTLTAPARTSVFASVTVPVCLDVLIVCVCADLIGGQAVSLFASVTVPSCSGATTFKYTWREASRRAASTAVDPR